MSARDVALEGELPPFVRRTLGLRARRRFRYDSLVRVRLGEPVFLLTHPDDVRHVLVSNAPNYIKGPQLTSARGRRRAGGGLLTGTGEEHLRQRRLLQPVFHRQAIERFDEAVRSQTERMLIRWRSGEVVELAAEMSHLTQSVILEVLFGNELGDDGLDELAGAIRKRRRYTELVYHGRLPFRERLPTRTVREHRLAIRAIDAVIYGAIERRRSGSMLSRDLISDLLGVTYPDGSAMTDRQVRDEILTFTSTGYETLGEALTWAWYLLGRHPEVEAKFFAELSGVLDGRKPLAADVPRLNYTEMVLTETIRLYPPTWLFARIPLEDDALPSGAFVPAGATLYLCQYVMHRHPRYFPDPERFDPARFAPNSRVPRFVYFPFGDGPHKCIGEHLAHLEGVLILALVSQRFRVALLDPSPAEPYAGITLRPRHSLWARVEDRSHSVWSAVKPRVPQV